MLRESMQTQGRTADLRAVANGYGEDFGVPHAALLGAFADAVYADDRERLPRLRRELRAALGDAGFVDAAAVAGAFHGFVRVADAIGIPFETASGGQDLPDLREAAGVNAFHRLQPGG